MITSNYSDLTKSPKIFAKCYWGNFKLDSGDYEKIKKIAENRNKFAEEFELVKYVSNQRPLNASFFDHCELYKCKKGYVYINSPYHGGKPEVINKMLQNHGLSLYLNLYSETAITYVKRFSNKCEFNRFIKKIPGIL